MLRSSKYGFVPQGSTVPPFGGGGGEFASQAEAEAGTDTTKYMNPLRTAEAIAALGGGGQLSAMDTATRDALIGLTTGYGIFNTDAVRPEWWAGAVWVDGAGAYVSKPLAGAMLNADAINANLVFRSILNEGSGSTLTDLSTAANDQTISGATWTTGDRGPCLQFDGTDDSVSGPDTALPAGSDDRTVAIRLRLPSPHDGANRAILEWGTYSFGQTCGLLFQSGHTLGTVIAQDYGGGYETNTPVDDGFWHTVILRITSGNWETFVDGEMDASNSLTLTTVLNGTFRIGFADGNSAYYQGQMDSLAIWDRALNDAEIAAWNANPYIGVS